MLTGNTSLCFSQNKMESDLIIIIEIQMIMTELISHGHSALSFSDTFMYFNLLELENSVAFLLCFYSNLFVWGPKNGLDISTDQWPQANSRRNLWAQETIFPIAFQNVPHRCSTKGKNVISTYKKKKKNYERIMQSDLYRLVEIIKHIHIHSTKVRRKFEGSTEFQIC